MISFKYKKHTSVTVDLSIGERITISGWGPKLDGEHTVTDAKFQPGCESGVMIKITGYDNWIDSGWVDKINQTKLI